MVDLPDTWDRNGSTSGPTPWKIYDDDDDDDGDDDDGLLTERLYVYYERETEFYILCR